MLAGHMASGERALRTHLRDVDVVWELCDARCPWASRNPRLRRLSGGKTRVLVLAKADLAPEPAVASWLRWLRAAGEIALAVDARSGRGLAALWRSSAQALAESGAAARQRLPRALVAGIPNVGKSTLLNRVGGQAKAVTGARPGVTRGPQWIETPAGRLLDLPGILPPRLAGAEAAWRLLAVGAIDEAAADPEVAAAALCAWMAQAVPRRLEERYGLEERGRGGAELVAAVAEARGMRSAGGVPDLARAAAAVLADFRRGALGAVALELPPATAAAPDGMPEPAPGASTEPGRP